jgi:predicted translation initiation factor SUI1
VAARNRGQKVVLFLGTAARAAADRFTATAGRIGLPWASASKDLAKEPATEDDLATADRVVALDEAAHRPLLEERFPEHAGRIEYWHIAGSDPAAIEREVADLVARLLGGRRGEDAPPSPAASEPPKKPATVRVGRETKGRRGKGVTTVADLPLDEAALHETATRFKGLCGSGGTVKDGRIEIQGDHRDRLATELERLGYRVKRVGG